GQQRNCSLHALTGGPRRRYSLAPSDGERAGARGKRPAPALSRTRCLHPHLTLPSPLPRRERRWNSLSRVSSTPRTAIASVRCSLTAGGRGNTSAASRGG